jgi:hypothetical protein
MKIVPIIRNGAIVKDNDKLPKDYPITNTGWKLMDSISLWHYLSSLKLMGVPDGENMVKFAGIQNFYLRTRNHIQQNNDLDPWGRRFKTYPPEPTHRGDAYTYYKYYSFHRDDTVYVITTTVNGFKVYCVDVVNTDQPY